MAPSRLCLTCGHVGCCDSSPGRHATKHFHHEGHPLIASFEPGDVGVVLCRRVRTAGTQSVIPYLRD